MAVSEKQKQINNAWQRRNYKRVGAKLYKEDAEAFEEYCRRNNKSVNAVLKEYIAQCLERPLTIRSEAAGEETDGQEE